MAHPFLRQILNVRWAPSQPGSYKDWGVLDGARDQRSYPAVVDTYLNNCCLWSGELP